MATFTDFEIAEQKSPYSPTHTSSFEQIMEAWLVQFNGVTQNYVLLNTLFLSLGTIEFILLIFFFSFLTKSSLLALSLGVIFLTFFSYFVFKLYFQAKKPEQFQELNQNYLVACRNAIRSREGTSSHHIAMANACIRLSDKLQGQENGLYQAPQALNFIQPYLDLFSKWCHWYDVLQMRELLLLSAVEENIKNIKCAPLEIEVHISLANTYVMLSTLYSAPKKMVEQGDDKLSLERYVPILVEKFKVTSERAIEELKIIKELIPDDPWIYAQLACSYHDLGKYEEEIKEYEALLTLSPDDLDTLFKLGVRYFQSGHNAKGLKMYEDLKALDVLKAEELIQYYGSFKIFVYP